ncbi:MAG: hypothetical protein AB8F95_14090 [Bacteroidia bacterium]
MLPNLLVIISLLAACQSAPQSLTLNAYLGGRSSDAFGRDVLNVNATVLNESSDTARFWTMACNYDDSFIVGQNDSLEIATRTLCFSNAPRLITLPPYYQSQFHIQVGLKDTLKDRIRGNFKVGMILTLSEEELHHYLNSEKSIDPEKVIWSNELDPNWMYPGYIHPIPQ